MGWLYLFCAGMCEIVYAAAMPRTVGFTKLGPSAFCAVFIMASMYLLSLAAKSVPIGTAYAVWVGIGAVGTAAYGMIALGEDHSVPRMLCFVMIIGGVVGLRVLGTAPAAA